jgi:hypothetical protein
MREMRKERMTRFNDLTAAQNELCTVLDEENESFVETILNSEGLNELEERVNKLAEETEARLSYLKEFEVNFKKLLKEHKLPLQTTSSLNYLDVFKVFTKEDIENKIERRQNQQI